MFSLPSSFAPSVTNLLEHGNNPGISILTYKCGCACGSCDHVVPLRLHTQLPLRPEMGRIEIVNILATGAENGATNTICCIMNRIIAPTLGGKNFTILGPLGIYGGGDVAATPVDIQGNSVGLHVFGINSSNLTNRLCQGRLIGMHLM